MCIVVDLQLILSTNSFSSILVDWFTAVCLRKMQMSGQVRLDSEVWGRT